MYDVILRRYLSGIFLHDLLCPGAFSGFGKSAVEQPPPPKLITSREAAKALAVSERTLWAIAERGEIPVVRIGRSVRYSPDDLSAWITKNKVCGGECRDGQ